MGIKVYIKKDEKDRVISVNSEIFIKDASGWTEIDEGDGDRYAHAQGNYFPEPLIDENGVWRYRYADGEVVERSEEERAEDIPEAVPAPPTNAELAAAIAEITYTADETKLGLEELKEYRIAKSKYNLQQYFRSHPMLFRDGKYYAVTEEKQNLLNSNLTSYERASRAGIEYPLKWNATGDECVEWTYEDLLALSLTIAAYVAPLISAQQRREVAIRQAENIEEVKAVSIDFGDDNSEENI